MLSHGFVILHGAKIVLFVKLHIPDLHGRFQYVENEVVCPKLRWHLLHVLPSTPAELSRIVASESISFLLKKALPNEIPLPRGSILLHLLIQLLLLLGIVGNLQLLVLHQFFHFEVFFPARFS